MPFGAVISLAPASLTTFLTIVAKRVHLEHVDAVLLEQVDGVLADRRARRAEARVDLDREAVLAAAQRRVGVADLRDVVFLDPGVGRVGADVHAVVLTQAAAGRVKAR